MTATQSFAWINFQNSYLKQLQLEERLQNKVASGKSVMFFKGADNGK
jgi:hypothetical protein